jgi:hypothetical protein
MVYLAHITPEFVMFTDEMKVDSVTAAATTTTNNNKQTPWLEFAGANYTDRATAACRQS